VVDSEGRSVGIVRDVMKFPANDVLVIDHQGREVLIPVVKEFILAIEPHKGTIAVRLIEGMLEE
jgi:16S rRNA processing protein RimM